MPLLFAKATPLPCVKSQTSKQTLCVESWVTLDVDVQVKSCPVKFSLLFDDLKLRRRRIHCPLNGKVAIFPGLDVFKISSFCKEGCELHHVVWDLADNLARCSTIGIQGKVETSNEYP